MVAFFEALVILFMGASLEDSLVFTCLACNHGNQASKNIDCKLKKRMITGYTT